MTFFNNGTTSLGTGTLSNGVATLSLTTLPAGTDSLTAVYAGDTNFLTSTSAAVSQVVTQGATSVVLSASNTNPFGFQAVTLTAIVRVATGSGTPTGTVTFYDSQGNNSGLRHADQQPGHAHGLQPPGRAESITAVYSGDSNFVGATSTPLAMVIGSPSELFVNQVYMDTLGIASVYSSAYWIALINGGYPPSWSRPSSSSPVRRRFRPSKGPISNCWVEPRPRPS